ncbi:unnamed protein product [Cochlearia groenlandica]
MNLLNLATSSSLPPPPLPPPAANDALAKRKRGRPRKEESLPQQETTQAVPTPDLVGKMVSGVVEGSFDAGYLLNVKVNDSDTKLRGLVFLPGRVTPITPENDVAPNVQMFTREDVVMNRTDDQSLPCDDQEAQDDANADLEMSESAQALNLLRNQSNGEEEPKEKDGVDEEGEAARRLVEFFPTQETTRMVSTGLSDLALAQRETRGFDLTSEERVPEELQLELGNKKIMNGDNNGVAMETEPKASASKSGFIAKLFEGEDKKVDCDMEEATPSVQ